MELKLKNLRFNRRGRIILEDITAIVPGGGLTCLLGANGTGKTTLLRIIAGELKPTAGRYFIGGRNAAALPREELSRYFSIIPQNAPVPPYLNVEEMVGLGRFQPHGSFWRHFTADDRKTVNECLELCRMAALKDRRVEELSGGEQRKAWLAFGLAADKSFLVLDETLDGLDLLAKRSFFRLLKRVASDKRGILLASHDLDMVAEFADRVIVLSEGKVIFEGAPDGSLSRFIPES